MNRIEEFEDCLDKLIKDFSDCSYEDLYDIVDWYSLYLKRRIDNKI